ncbi:hypothetical protein KOW79_010250 [Hemibagrus wyckioides]|uniref:Uncharacterized protein n=1 Tax=Hemibagrus wyckioides TaxID=337641 RepID=A0A9D3NRD9_9TELE|nr:hypothetical protein KOW79_010250 [Hemibagrus wyckioides]
MTALLIAEVSELGPDWRQKGEPGWKCKPRLSGSGASVQHTPLLETFIRGSWEADIALELTGLGDPRRPRDRKIDDCSDRRDQSNVPALPVRLKLAAGTGRRGERREDFILTASHAGVTGSGTEDQDEEDHLKRTTNSRR